ncbi:hypothetical protein [Clostridium folliculivorans]|uniref:Uncharacterized protein n=1 Tax=Clostridium folliculivorans TaxID=2886038 RepID=A0A9W6D9M5_9CLOT|nr:hypothetical protein [Clostridium folliculivorans]GKU24314.1 hypothetical protein CFOLD11_11400 [Clostridium folliculivorans]GKU30418.1 hypothetical protein CFB3_25250 [Clostridium folliculivorans]
MGMDILKSATRKNKVYIRIKSECKFIPDISVFPLYCTCCNAPQSKLYEHLGSRYGQVGTAICEKCGKEICVTDHDNIVASIYINNYPSNEIFFNKLYLLDWKFVDKLDEFPIKNTLEKVTEELKKYDGNFINVDELREIIENIINIKTDGKMRFITDERFSILPDDINRWIELLYRAKIDIPAKVV